MRWKERLERVIGALQHYWPAVAGGMMLIGLAQAYDHNQNERQSWKVVAKLQTEVQELEKLVQSLKSEGHPCSKYRNDGQIMFG